jgi:hypothetical protein
LSADGSLGSQGSCGTSARTKANIRSPRLRCGARGIARRLLARRILGVHVRPRAAVLRPVSQRLAEPGLRLGARREAARWPGIAAPHGGAGKKGSRPLPETLPVRGAAETKGSPHSASPRSLWALISRIDAAFPYACHLLPKVRGLVAFLVERFTPAPPGSAQQPASRSACPLQRVDCMG